MTRLPGTAPALLLVIVGGCSTDDDDLTDIAHLTADPDSGLVVRGHQFYSNSGFRAS